MSIVCGTDFSEMAAHATTVAGCLAARTGQPLHLVHALDLLPEVLQVQPGHPLALWAEQQLAREAERLRDLGVDVRLRVVAGPADKVLEAAAHDASASAIVVGAVGHDGSSSGKLGTRAERTAERAHVPVLAVRDSAAFLAWFKEGRPLRVVLGVDDSESVENAARWLDTICQLGPVQLSLVHLYWPPEAYRRLGIDGFRDFVTPDEQIVKTLEQQFSRRLNGLLHAQHRTYCIEPHLGRVGDGLAGVAAARNADLLVVGRRALGALERLWEGSVARCALRAASMSVACVPALAVSGTLHVPRLRRVLVATDFSELGNGAIPLAYAAVSHGGTVHLLHVVKSGDPAVDRYDVFAPAPDDALTSDAIAAATSRLEQLIPSDAGAKGTSTQVHVLASRDAWETICQAAERLDVDLICLGTHARTGVAKAALGSVAAHVLSNSRRPLLLARAPRP
jgi:nucleotide-binding universal stress UspA family protein